MSLLRHLRAAWLFLRYHPYIEAADAAPFWTREDAAAYTTFVHSPAGRKLAILSANSVTKSAVDATLATSNMPYRCGWAAGIAATFSWLDSHLLSPVGAQSDKTQGTELGTPDPFEHLVP